MVKTPLSPRGTARERFAGLGHTPPAGDQLSAFFRRIAVGARYHDLGDDSLNLAEELVRLQWSLGEREQQALALLVLASMLSVRQGSTRIPLGGGIDGYLGRIVRSIMRAAGLAAKPAIILSDMETIARSFTFDRLIGRRGEYRPLVVADDCVYQQRMLRSEDALVSRLETLLDRKGGEGPRGDVDAAVADVLARPAFRGEDPVQLSSEQSAAVRHAAGSRFAVVSGGPGTGKTAIIVAVLRAACRLGLSPESIALAAPTGKAVNRMAQSVRAGLHSIAEPAEVDIALVERLPDPRTLHRLLGYLPAVGRFRHNENSPLPCSLVCVDEASMIDVMLMERLLAALPDGARLVLFGDADQLPSVDAGAVLRDLVSADREHASSGQGRAYAVTLTHSYRMDPSDPSGAAILGAAKSIHDGRAEALLDQLHQVTEPEQLHFQGAELLDTRSNPGRASAFVQAWYEARILAAPDYQRLTSSVYQWRDGAFDESDSTDLLALFGIYERSRLLTVTRHGRGGSQAINAALHESVLAGSSLEHSAEFYPGEPILMRRNDYQRGLFNGDQGLIVRVAEDGMPHHFRAVFPRPDGFSVFHLDALRAEVELAFAMTVHKAQGSEYDHIAVLLPTSDVPLLTRELLYTALTRARRSVVIASGTSMLRIAVNRTVERFSGIAEKLSSGE